MHILPPEAHRQLKDLLMLQSHLEEIRHSVFFQSRHHQQSNVQMQHEQLQDKQRMQGGILQYAREPSDLDDAILVLRERKAVDFLAPLIDILKANPSIDMTLYIVYLFILVYPDTITEEQTKDYELRKAKKFVPDSFIRELPLFKNSSKILSEGIYSAWPQNMNTLSSELPQIQLKDLTTQLFFDPEQQTAARQLYEYSLDRHVLIQQMAVKENGPPEAAVAFVIKHLTRIQQEEILNIYFEQLLGTEVLRSFYQNSGIDMYTNDYSQLVLPIQDDPFLKELDLFISQSEQFVPGKRERFIEKQMDDVFEALQLDDKLHDQELPEFLQQQILLQAFNNKTILSKQMIPYGLIIGHQNIALKNINTNIEMQSIVSTVNQIEGESQFDFEQSHFYQVKDHKKFLRDTIHGVIQGFDLYDPQRDPSLAFLGP